MDFQSLALINKRKECRRPHKPSFVIGVSYIYLLFVFLHYPYKKQIYLYCRILLKELVTEE